MTLDEILDELRTNILHDDADLASGPDDRLWSDETLVRYLNDAQRKFARRALVLRDASTPEVTEFTLQAGVAAYVLHKSVLAVASAKLDARVNDLARVGRSLLSQTTYPEAPEFDVNQVVGQSPGEPTMFSTDEGLELPEDSSVTLTVYPTPTTTQDGMLVKLRVARLPLFSLSLDKGENSPEIPEDHHLNLLDWVAFRCYNTADLDGASVDAAKHLKLFEVALTEARREQQKKMFTPTRWRIGQGGFTWSH